MTWVGVGRGEKVAHTKKKKRKHPENGQQKYQMPCQVWLWGRRFFFKPFHSIFLPLSIVKRSHQPSVWLECVPAQQHEREMSCTWVRCACLLIRFTFDIILYRREGTANKRSKHSRFEKQLYKLQIYLLVGETNKSDIFGFIRYQYSQCPQKTCEIVVVTTVDIENP